MLSPDRMACCFLRDRDADIASSRDSNGEVRYKLVGFGRSGRRKPTGVTVQRFQSPPSTIVPRTELECMR
jgi:hypothetical protein